MNVLLEYHVRMAEKLNSVKQDSSLRDDLRGGIAAAVLCYVLWGSFPLYWNMLAHVNSLEIIAHRIIWCFVTTTIACLVMRLDLVRLIRQKRAWRYLSVAAVLIALNWGIYTYAVVSGYVVETAIGYYINPLVSIVLGIIAFGERLTRLQIIAVLLCVVGVVFFTVSNGAFPWIALTLAVSFGIYGAIKKKADYPATLSLAFENIILFLPAIACAITVAEISGSHAFLDFSSNQCLWNTALLVLAGPVTAIPLILFAKATISIPLSLLGFIQYLSPTITLLVGVFLLNEPFTIAHAICLGCIWIGLALVSIDAVRYR